MDNIPSQPFSIGGAPMREPEDIRKVPDELLELRSVAMRVPAGPTTPGTTTQLSDPFSQLFGEAPISDDMSAGLGMSTLLALKSAFDQVPEK